MAAKDSQERARAGHEDTQPLDQNQALKRILEELHEVRQLVGDNQYRQDPPQAQPKDGEAEADEVALFHLSTCRSVSDFLTQCDKVRACRCPCARARVCVRECVCARARVCVSQVCDLRICGPDLNVR